MYKLALIGKDLSHSRSKEVYEKLLKNVEYTYLEYSNENKIPDLKILLDDYDGISVTAPYKKKIYDLVSTDSSVNQLEAVNCFKLSQDRVLGTNTDYLGALEILARYKESAVLKPLIIGDGSMSNVIQIACKQIGMNFTISSRKLDKLDKLKGDLSIYDLIINTCSREFDLFSVNFKNKQHIWDLNYNQSYSVSIKEKYQGLYTDGKELLELQAKFACKYWEIY